MIKSLIMYCYRFICSLFIGIVTKIFRIISSQITNFGMTNSNTFSQIIPRHASKSFSFTITKRIHDKSFESCNFKDTSFLIMVADKIMVFSPFNGEFIWATVWKIMVNEKT